MADHEPDNHGRNAEIKDGVTLYSDTETDEDSGTTGKQKSGTPPQRVSTAGARKARKNSCTKREDIVITAIANVTQDATIECISVAALHNNQSML